MVILLTLLYDFSWIFGAVIFYWIALIPSYYFIKWSESFALPWFIFAYPSAFFIFLVNIILFTGLIKTLALPSLKEGKYKFPEDKHIIIWLMNMTVGQYLMVPFNKLVYLLSIFRFISMRLFGLRLHFSTKISTNTYLRDFNLLKIGNNTQIGSGVVFYGHVQPNFGALILARNEIGDNSIINEKCIIACGCKIGNNVSISSHCLLGIGNRIGNNCSIGLNTTIGNQTNMGDDVKIGKFCAVGNRVTVNNGIMIRDFSEIPDKSVINIQEEALKFCTVRQI